MSHDPLFQQGQDSAAMLRIGRCSGCGHTFFPIQRFGCERCGASGQALQDELVSANGVVKTSVTVFRHRSPDIEAPFQLASVQLDAGPQVSALLDARPDASVRSGTRVTGTTAESSGGALPAFRFKVEEEPHA
ncbi:MAG: hypothetical protein QM750_24445 [Rubrivivax sp.]